MREANSGEILAVRMRKADIFTVPACKSRLTFAPKERAASSIEETSSILGTFSKTTSSEVRSDAAIIGRTAFLFPCTL
jgi:hypothetical protein